MFSFLFFLCFFTLRPLLIFIVFLSSTYPEGGGCVFLSQTSIIHMRLQVLITHINTAATSQHLQASAITSGNTNSAMDFSRNKKMEDKHQFCLHGPLTTHAFGRYWGRTEFGRETWLDLMVETQDVYKLRFNIVTASISIQATHFPNRLRFLPTKLHELDSSDECTRPLCYDWKRER